MFRLRLKQHIGVLDLSYRKALRGKHVIQHSATKTLASFVVQIATKGLYLLEIIRLLIRKLKSVSEHRLCYLLALRNLDIVHENT